MAQNWKGPSSFSNVILSFYRGGNWVQRNLLKGASDSTCQVVQSCLTLCDSIWGSSGKDTGVVYYFPPQLILQMRKLRQTGLSDSANRIKHWSWSQEDSSFWVQIWPQALIGCVILGSKSLVPDCLSFLICKMSWKRKWQTTSVSLPRKPQMESQRVRHNWNDWTTILNYTELNLIYHLYVEE